MTALLHRLAGWLLAAVRPADASGCVCNVRARERRFPPTGW